MGSTKYTNIVLTIIALLLAGIAALLYEQRPISRADLRAAVQRGDGSYPELVQRLPLVYVQGGSVEVDNTVDVQVHEPVAVTIER